MSEGVVAHIVAGLILASDDLRILAGGFADDEKSRRSIFLFQDIENLRSPSGIGTVVEGESQLVRRRTHLFDSPGQWISLIGLVVDNVAAGIVIDGAAAALRGCGNAPNIAIPFENQVVA